MVLSLYKVDASPPVKAAMMTIEALGLPDVNFIDVDFFGGEHLSENFKKMNPQHTVPTLKDDDFAIWDSHAIGVYLVTKYDKDDALYPSDPQKRAIVDQRLHFDSGVLFPALRDSIAPVCSGGETSLRPDKLENIKKAYEFIESFLKSDWLAGDDFTLADICCGSTTSNLNEIYPIDAKLYPKLTAWLGRCSQKEIFKKINAPATATFGGFLRSKLT